MTDRFTSFETDFCRTGGMSLIIVQEQELG